MAPRKSVEETSRAIAMLRTTEFMAASLGPALKVRGIVGALQQVLQDRAFQRGEFRRTATARTRDIDIDIVRDAAVLDDKHAIGQSDRFRYVMRHQDRGKGLIVPDPFQ